MRANPSSSSAQSGTQNRISDTTKLLLDKRRAMKRESGIDNIEYHLLCHLIRIKLREDFANYNCSRLLQAAEQRKSIKKCSRQLSMYNGVISALIDSNGKETRNKRQMTQICKNFNLAKTFQRLFGVYNANNDPFRWHQHRRRKSQPSEICRRHYPDRNYDNRFTTNNTRSLGKE